MPEKQFSWLWYYAMQQMGDDDARQQSSELMNKLRERVKVSNTIATFMPTLHTQQHLNHLAKSGLSNYLLFLESTAQFHKKKRLYFYPKIFEEAPVHSENWKQWKVEYFEDEVKVDWVMTMIPFLTYISLFLLAGYLNIKRTVE